MKKKVAALLAYLSITSALFAQHISIDQTFGSGGVLKQSFTIGTGNGSSTDYSYDMVTLSDNKAFVCGTTESSCTQEDFAVVKLLPNGQLDKSFNGNGISVLSLSSGEDWAYSIALQNNGKAVIAGAVRQSTYNFDFALARMNADGSLDETFNNTGFVFVDFGGFDQATDVEMWGDKIVVAGYSIVSQDTSYAVARFNADGTLDATFNGSGIKRFAEPGSEIINEMVVDGTGNIIIAGYKNPISTSDMYVVKISPDGSYNTSFDGDGKKNFSLYNYVDELVDVVIQSNGKLVLAGSSYEKVSTYVINAYSVILRLNTDGTFDNSFDTDGIYVKPDITGSPSKILVDGSGNIISASRHYNYPDPSYNLELYKINANAVPDATFGSNGYVSLPVVNYEETNSLQLDAQGRIVSTAYSFDNGFTTVRCLSNGTLDNTYGTAGVTTNKTSTSSESIKSIQYTKSGGILITGDINWGWLQPVLSKLTADGSLDKTFANGAGSEIYPLQTYASTSDVLELKDKSFIHLIYNKVIKMTEAGAMQTSFNATGYVDFDLNEPVSYAKMVLATPDESLIVAGITSAADYSEASKKIGIIKLLPDGNFDNSFGTNGKVKIAISDYLPGKIITDNVLAVKLLTNGKILIATSIGGALLIRLNSDGTIDNTFGSNGFYQNSTDNVFSLNDIAVQNDGNILLIGKVATSVNQAGLAIRRLSANGVQIDATFNGTGMYSILDFSSSEALKAYVNNEHILIVGYAADADYNPSHLIVQLNMDGSIASDFNGGTYYTRALAPGSFYSSVVTKSSDGKLLLMNDVNCRYTAIQYLTNQVDQAPPVVPVTTSILAPGSSSKTNDLIVFPNPAKQNFKINLINSTVTKGLLLITDAAGYEVKYIESYNFSEDVLINDLKPGLYFIKVNTTDGNSYTKKLIVN